MRISDWSSDVCASDLLEADEALQGDRRADILAGGGNDFGDGSLAVHHEQLRQQRVFLAIFGDRAVDHLADDFGGLARLSGLFLGDRAFAGDERAEEHTSELQSLMRISYAAFCLTTHKPKYSEGKTQ